MSANTTSTRGQDSRKPFYVSNVDQPASDAIVIIDSDNEVEVVLPKKSPKVPASPPVQVSLVSDDEEEKQKDPLPVADVPAPTLSNTQHDSETEDEIMVPVSVPAVVPVPASDAVPMNVDNEDKDASLQSKPADVPVVAEKEKILPSTEKEDKPYENVPKSKVTSPYKNFSDNDPEEEVIETEEKPSEESPETEDEFAPKKPAKKSKAQKIREKKEAAKEKKKAEKKAEKEAEKEKKRAEKEAEKEKKKAEKEAEKEKKKAEKEAEKAKKKAEKEKKQKEDKKTKPKSPPKSSDEEKTESEAEVPEEKETTSKVLPVLDNLCPFGNKKDKILVSADKQTLFFVKEPKILNRISLNCRLFQFFALGTNDACNYGVPYVSDDKFNGKLKGKKVSYLHVPFAYPEDAQGESIKPNEEGEYKLENFGLRPLADLIKEEPARFMKHFFLDFLKISFIRYVIFSKARITDFFIRDDQLCTFPPMNSEREKADAKDIAGTPEQEDEWRVWKSFIPSKHGIPAPLLKDAFSKVLDEFKVFADEIVTILDKLSAIEEGGEKSIPLAGTKETKYLDAITKDDLEMINSSFPAIAIAKVTYTGIDFVISRVTQVSISYEKFLEKLAEEGEKTTKKKSTKKTTKKPSKEEEKTEEEEEEEGEEEDLSEEESQAEESDGKSEVVSKKRKAEDAKLEERDILVAKARKANEKAEKAKAKLREADALLGKAIKKSLRPPTTTTYSMSDSSSEDEDFDPSNEKEHDDPIIDDEETDDAMDE